MGEHYESAYEFVLKIEDRYICLWFVYPGAYLCMHALISNGEFVCVLFGQGVYMCHRLTLMKMCC